MSDFSTGASGPTGASEGGGNAELREFLRSRRARITPEEAGLSPQGGVRRVPGLRREEVAQLAGVSVDYYVRLERGRTTSVSESVLDAVARALRLDDTERGHLFAVARRSRARRRPMAPQRVRPGLYRVLETVGDSPAMVLGRRMDVLATNRLARALFTDFDALPHRERNMVRYIFLDESARELYTDWESSARGSVASLHLYAGRHPEDPLLAELIGELSLRDEDFRRWWADHDVLLRTHGSKRYHHPVVGDLDLEYEALTPAGDPEQTLGLHTAEPGSPSEQALRLLASWTAPERDVQERRDVRERDEREHRHGPGPGR
ncbi:MULTISPECIES: helix-turn-helix transcriptional regulator [unclassified Streptomyces]|uniref:helix-turn-helix transcriptional regulator n=1 Tax=unclassified Streptomyces TaxID=2593676 RepID=UPI00081E2FB4|nr:MULTISPECIES: helix-turn-helix transcriptional regulator [unclassified Streptomyces]MYZ36408.1 helix-turn-helix domain-containing protein [Streptomyces sp. SID4917]SCF83318.1 Helix-turn-helix domain-containing protein [Streptomyces sp. MnatMP-M17]